MVVGVNIIGKIWVFGCLGVCLIHVVIETAIQSLAADGVVLLGWLKDFRLVLYQFL